MKRKEFLAAVHELAEQLGSHLYDLVQGESDRLRAAALEVATAERAARASAPSGRPTR